MKITKHVWFLKVYECSGYPHSSSQSPFLRVCVCACVFFIYICICRLLRFTNVMVSGSSSHHHSSIWCPPTHQPTIGKTSHIFCHKFQIQLKKELNMSFLNLLHVHRSRSEHRGNSSANLQKTNIVKMTKEKKRLASEREMANVHFHFVG